MQARARRAGDMTDEVIERFAGCDDPRLRELAQSLVRHLHAFAVDVGLTQDDFRERSGLPSYPPHSSSSRSCDAAPLDCMDCTTMKEADS
jgi:hypothetical protein